ncbi:conserved hypothetical protein [Desulfatibacillum aliphaticivorans]|uniref:Type II secretion system protein H n=1 Tax=Desulfatibacillum aliphaticivorans TaxID=218208 RepID=B8FD72_DESAL|nr:type II secretion system protein [Desulfatibacillum aliphaticivorans]ACL06503.1 conserved hypothetical protein [Desulfatibacillum aliphaticivorans]
MSITDINKAARTPGSQHGFTLLEVVSVLLIIGILSAVVITRASMSLDVTMVAEAEALKAQLRYAQRRAMTSGDPWGINISGNSYSMFYYDGNRNTVSMPGATDTSRNLGSLGISVTGAIVSFDSWGRPCTGDSGTSPRTSDLTLTVSKGSVSRTITVTKNTGFIP